VIFQKHGWYMLITILSVLGSTGMFFVLESTYHLERSNTSGQALAPTDNKEDAPTAELLVDNDPDTSITWTRIAQSPTMVSAEPGDSALATFDSVPPAPVTASLATANAPTWSVTNTVFSYGFDEGTGIWSPDTSANGFSGRIKGANWATGKYGNSLRFNGTNGSVIGRDIDFVSGPFTITAWFKTASSDTQTIIAKSNKPNKGTSIKIVDGIVVAGIDDGTQWREVKSTVKVDDCQWHHLAMVVSSTHITLYVDGKQMSSETHDNSFPVNNIRWRIGSFADGVETFNGLIDEIRIYDKQLTSQDVAVEMSTRTTCDTVYQNTFQDMVIGSYTKEMLYRTWNAQGGQVTGIDERRVRIMGSEDDKIIRVTYPNASLGPAEGGAIWVHWLPNRREEVYSSYKVRFAPDFDFVINGKLPGVAGGTVVPGVNPAGKGWSVHSAWINRAATPTTPELKGVGMQSVYHIDQPGLYGETIIWRNATNQPFVFTPGKWYHIETRVVMNTPGQNNGIVQTWVNGQLVVDRRDLRFRNDNNLAIDRFVFSTFFGGNERSYASSKYQHSFFDDFMLATERIGPGIKPACRGGTMQQPALSVNTPALPAGAQYFGYYSTEPEYYDEVKDISNTVMVTVNYNKISESVSKLAEAKRRNLKVVLRGPLPGPARVNNNGQWYLTAAEETAWRDFTNAVQPYRNTILAIYPVDEPYWNAWRAEQARLGRNLTMEEEKAVSRTLKPRMEAVNARYKAAFPSTPLILVEAYPVIRDDFEIPAGYDWIGFDCYFSYEGCLIPQRFTIIQSKLQSGQRLVAVPQAFLWTPNLNVTPSQTQGQELVTYIDTFQNYVQSNPRFVIVLGWPYNVRDVGERGVYWGLRSLDGTVQTRYAAWAETVQPPICEI
jgi:hypothetical protein